MACAPDVVIHTQALSDVDRCEREPHLARQMNVQTTANLVEALHGTQALLVYLSTDYVFDGRKGSAYAETDATNPISVYGRSKLEGEQVALSRDRAVVARPSTIFGAARMNFCDHVVARLKSGQPVEAFTDQVTSPTYADDLAAALHALSLALAPSSAEAPRVYHTANAGSCSRVQFAQRVADLIGAPRTLIHAIAMAQQQRPAPRPACSALTTTQLPPSIRRILRPWDDALEAYLRQRHPTTCAGLPEADREATE